MTNRGWVKLSLGLAMFGAMGALPACGSDEVSPLQADIAWRVRCQEAGGCVEKTKYEIIAIDGEKGHSVTCSVSKASDTSKTLAFQARKGTEYGITVNTATFTGTGGGVTTSNCSLKLYEDGNEYAGACSGADPSPAVPCQIDGISIEDGEDGPYITGKVLCIGLPLTSDVTRQREITGPSGSGPATFKFTNCRGL